MKDVRRRTEAQVADVTTSWSGSRDPARPLLDPRWDGSDDRQKTTQIGGSPPKAVARLTLYDELGEERLGNPMFICPGWQDFDV